MMIKRRWNIPIKKNNHKQATITNKRWKLRGDNDHQQKKKFKKRCPSWTKDDNKKEVVINNKRWWLKGGGDLLEGDEKKCQHGHMLLIVHTNQKEREYNWMGVEQLNMNAWHHRGCAKMWHCLKL